MCAVFRRATPILAAMFLVACGGTTSETVTRSTAAADPAPVTTAGTAPAAGAVGAVPAALQFSAPLVGGGEVEFGPSAGRPVLLWFWAPW